MGLLYIYIFTNHESQ